MLDPVHMLSDRLPVRETDLGLDGVLVEDHTSGAALDQGTGQTEVVLCVSESLAQRDHGGAGGDVAVWVEEQLAL